MACHKLEYYPTSPLKLAYSKQRETKQNTAFYFFDISKKGRRTLKNGFNHYTFGFNGKENLNEVTGSTGTHLDFGARVYDSRLGRFLSVDPLTTVTPFLSSFQFANNNPILCIDKNGEIYVIYTGEKTSDGKPEVVLFDGKDVYTSVDENGKKNMYSGNNQFVNDVVTSYNYIVNNGADVDNIMENYATSPTQTVNIKRGVDPYEDHYNSKTNTISWTPEFGAKVEGFVRDYNSGQDVKENGKKIEVNGMMSSAMRLFHEMVEKYLTENQSKDEAKKIDKEFRFGGYEIGQDWFIIFNYEHKAIDKLNENNNNETKRYSTTEGHPKKVVGGPTSTVEDNQQE